MAINKVVYGATTLVDLTSDTVESASDIAIGKVGHLKDGTVVTGTHQGGITPSGTITITQNGTTDVTNYASASVQVVCSVSGETLICPVGTLEVS